MKHLDLFSGIGGFALAADRVFGEVEHTFCEIDPFCNEILKKHWPKAPIVFDIRQLTAHSILREHNAKQNKIYETNKIQKISGEALDTGKFIGADLLTGGFPCQPFSQAGRRRGTEDDRHLWPEMLRVIREFHPRWVIGENVGGFVTWNGGMVLEQVHAELESEGYSVQAFIIPACAVNAPHRRDRVWIVANDRSSRLQEKGSELKAKGRRGNNSVTSDTFSTGTGSTHGNEVGTGECGRQEPDKRERGEVWSDITDGSTQRGDVADSPFFNEERGKRKRNSRGRPERKDRNTSWNENWLEVATRLCRMDDGLPKRLDRNPRLKALGNAIVPQVAEEIMRAIKNCND